MPDLYDVIIVGAGLRPTIAYPGHGEVIHDVPALVRKRIAFHRRRANKIYDTLKSSPLTLWEITQPIFPKLKHGMDYFLGLSEILGHLDLLVEENRVESVRHAEVMRWRVC